MTRTPGALRDLRMRPRSLIFGALFLQWITSMAISDSERWFRGNTHTHSLWSDGNDFPEMIIGWYKEQGYDFIALSDHNILAVSEKWMDVESIQKRQKALGRSALEKYQKKYDQDWVETREVEGRTQVRLKKISEFRPLFEEPGKFHIIQAEEISSSAGGKPVHINAVNLPGKNTIPAVRSEGSVREVMRQNLQDVAKLEEQTGVPILTHLNHPNFGWAITAEDIAHVLEEQFFEVYNGHPGIRHLGDEIHPGDERIWDIANTIRIAELQAEPLFGVATDDSHNYHGGNVSPGRGWVMVRAATLDGSSLVEAMRAGEFYASSGVYVEEIRYDAASRELAFQIQPDGEATFQAELIGTRENYEESQIGEVLATAEGPSIRFRVPTGVLYARVAITSSRAHPNPSFPGQKEQAWLQPIGWRK